MLLAISAFSIKIKKNKEQVLLCAHYLMISLKSCQ